jgi:hypothetical protein
MEVRVKKEIKTLYTMRLTKADRKFMAICAQRLASKRGTSKPLPYSAVIREAVANLYTTLEPVIFN